MFKIGKKKIGSGYPPYLIAEMSANHNGKISNAFKTIKSAYLTGADAIKLQTYTPDTITINSNKRDFQIKKGHWKGNSLYQLYKSAFTPFEWHKELFDFAKYCGIECFSTPFDKSSVDLLEKLNTPAYKIASFEVIDIPLLKYVASTNKPIIMSTGMANINEINEAVETIKSFGNGKLSLLHCVSGYPTPINELNLNTISDLKQRFNVNVGLSDHSLGTSVASAAIALGASIIEKHFILNKKIKSPDMHFSLTPKEFKNLVKISKLTFEAIGNANYKLKKTEKENIKFRKSIYVVNDIKKGDYFSDYNIRVIRPGYGYHPRNLDKILGTKSKFNIKSGTALKPKHLGK